MAKNDWMWEVSEFLRLSERLPAISTTSNGVRDRTITLRRLLIGAGCEVICCSGCIRMTSRLFQMKLHLHDKGIHSLTIQPEFKDTPSKHCSMVCPSDACKRKVCCEVIANKKVRKSVLVCYHILSVDFWQK